MPPPTEQEVAVATQSLRTEAGVWDRLSGQMETMTGKAEGLRLSRLEAGVFQVIVSAYDEVADQVTNRCREGQQRMSEIAATLRHVADTYEAEDRNQEHAIRNLH